MTRSSLTFRRPVVIAAAFVATLAAVLVLALAPGGPSPSTASAAATVTINIKDYEYSKKTVTIKRGQTVKWVNRDEMKHNATSNKSGGPKGKLLAKGKSYTWKATKKGTFSYFCTPHPFMKGKIVVK